LPYVFAPRYMSAQPTCQETLSEALACLPGGCRSACLGTRDTIVKICCFRRRILALRRARQRWLVLVVQKVGCDRSRRGGVGHGGGIARDTCRKPRSRNIALREDRARTLCQMRPTVRLIARFLRLSAGAGPWLLGRRPSFNTGAIRRLSVLDVSLVVVLSSKDAQECLGNRLMPRVVLQHGFLRSTR
jgi:hypothetical protein